ncbi:lysylphosphatidylglycerol synthase transmembrane domain-containing protein [Stratiformator vulcanicus]|uniref:Flippase-like domain-containing protein n=1 Tax=Stratiformator vulcanicus TaxID=2527980 RepID=A0A517R3S5_9PLAN|nr:lysylphosphatidylglycerol synthase transmembrane domain-containing protein [Stratiformator vulcanicus]QDT38542.1 hypothetical protein Pan189_29360 [Stratiformator vulcanicus]
MSAVSNTVAMTFGERFKSVRLSPKARSISWKVFNWLLCVAVLIFVGMQGWKLWNDGRDSAGEIQLHYGWLALSGLFYAVGWFPSIWFWQRLMRRMGDHIPWQAVARAYYCGHLGKYLPGKAFVVIIRGQMCAAAGGRMRTAVVTVFYETLIMMGCGLAVMVALAPALFPAEVGSRVPEAMQKFLADTSLISLVEQPYLAPILTFVACLLALPLISRLLTIVAVKAAPAGVDAETLRRPIDWKLIGAGLVSFVVAWYLQGLSLWASLRAVGSDAALADINVWTEISTIGTVGGFLAVFSPGGLGVREGLVLNLLKLQPDVGPRAAILATVLVRVVWFVTEIIVAGVLYMAVHPRRLAKSASRPMDESISRQEADLPPEESSCKTNAPNSPSSSPS